MRAQENSECLGCGNPFIIEGETRVQMRGKTVVACEVCDPRLLEEQQEDDPGVVRTIRVKVGYQVFASAKWWVYKVSFDGSPPSDVPDGATKRKTFTAVGPIGDFSRRDVITLIGRFVVDPKRGFQFQAAAKGVLAITGSEASLVSWLSLLPQVGPSRSREMVRRFGGLEGLLAILDSPDERDVLKLTEIKGITEERALAIREAYLKDTGHKAFRLFGAKLGIPEIYMSAAIEAWGEEAQEVVETDPYLLLELKGGFKTIDKVALNLIEKNDLRRCGAALHHAIELNTAEGHTYTTEEELKQFYGRSLSARFLRSLDFTEGMVEDGLQLLVENRSVTTRRGRTFAYPPKILREEGRIQPVELARAEKSIAFHIKRLQSQPKTPFPKALQVTWPFEPTEEQIRAVHVAYNEQVMVLTGQPGTGKTAVTKVILDLLEGHNHVILCAPTGKAAMRIKELTGREASTVHRLLGIHASGGEYSQIEGDVLIVDETSMCDVELIARLLRAAPDHMRVIFIGDVDQLPSIGPGQVLRDLIQSETVPVVRLTKIHRQESDGLSKRIPYVCRDIKMGKAPDLAIKGTNVNFLAYDDVALAQEAIVRAVTRWLPDKYGYRPEEIQVLAAKKGQEYQKDYALGVRGLNLALQEKLNPRIDVEIHIGDGYVARPMDRVIHTKNNYDLGVMNGEQGIVLEIHPNGFSPAPDVMTSFRAQQIKEGLQCPTCRGQDVVSDDETGQPIPCSTCVRRTGKTEPPDIRMSVDYGERLVGYTAAELKDVQLAYALTTHKSQGSSYKAVVMPIPGSHLGMLTQALLYTATSRAEEYILFVGQQHVVERAVKNIRDTHRRTTLLERLRAELT